MNFHQDQIFLGFLTDLLEEPFACERNFIEKSLETVCEEVELAYGSLDAGTESFQKARELVCLILCQLELLGASEMPKGSLRSLLEIRKEPPQSSFESKFLAAVELFKSLKQKGETNLEASHFDRLIAQHICLEAEDQANVFLKPLLQRSFPNKEKFYSLEQLSVLALALDLDPTLTQHLEKLCVKKKEAFNWEIELSEWWFADLDLDFASTLHRLEELFESPKNTKKAA